MTWNILNSYCLVKVEAKANKYLNINNDRKSMLPKIASNPQSVDSVRGSFSHRRLLLLPWKCYIYFLVEDIQWKLKVFQIIFYDDDSSSSSCHPTLKRFSFGRFAFFCARVDEGIKEEARRCSRDAFRWASQGGRIDWNSISVVASTTASPAPARLIILYSACLMFFL